MQLQVFKHEACKSKTKGRRFFSNGYSQRVTVPRLRLDIAMKTLKKDDSSMPSRHTRRMSMGPGSSGRRPIFLTPGAPRGCFQGPRIPGGLLDTRTGVRDLRELASRLGEAYVARDLASMLRYKSVLVEISGDSLHSEKEKLHDSPLNRENATKEHGTYDSSDVVSIEHDSQRQTLIAVRRYLLRILAALVEHHHDEGFVSTCPVNLLYCELVLSFRESEYVLDPSFRKLLCDVLRNHSQWVEQVHSVHWSEVCAGMSASQQLSFRRGLDRFLCRINNRLCALFEMPWSQCMGDIIVQLQVLEEYMRYCETRVMAVQVADICLGSLLKIKNKLQTRTLPPLRGALLLHSLLGVVAQLFRLSKHPPLNSLLLALFLHRTRSFELVRQYTWQILFDKRLEAEILGEDGGKERLWRQRTRVFFHWDNLVKLIAEQLRRVDDLSEQPEQRKSSLVDMLSRLDFLFHPNTGCIMQVLKNYGNEAEDQFNEVRKQMLLLLLHALEIPSSPFSHKKKYIDYYISYFYLSFTELYSKGQHDQETLDLCTLYLRILFAFAATKTERSTVKFYQLRVMDFLVWEVSLEYEIQYDWERFVDPQLRGPFFHFSRPKSRILPHSQSVPSELGTIAKKLSAPPEENDLCLDERRLREKESFTVPSLRLAPLNNPPTPPQGDSPPEVGEEHPPREKKRTVPPLKMTHLRVPSLSLGTLKPPQVAAPLSDPGRSSSSSSKPSVPRLALAMPKSLESVEALENRKVPDGEAEDNIVHASECKEFGDDPALLGKVETPLKGNVRIPLVPRLKLTPEVCDKGPYVEDELSNINKSKDSPVGPMTHLERSLHLDPDNPKFQLMLDKPRSQPQIRSSIPLSQQEESSILSVEKLYSRARARRKLYSDQELHIYVILLIFNVMLRSNGTLDPLYSDQFPLNNKKLNIPFILHQHLNHPRNAAIVSALVRSTRRLMHPAAFRLLKLLCVRLFRSELYQELEKVATGAYGVIYRCSLSFSQESGLWERDRRLVVKQCHLPKTLFDRCVLHDIFTEVLVLDSFKSDSRACHLYDYGLDNDNYWLVMMEYNSSMKQWRRQQKKSLAANLPLYLNIFEGVLQCSHFLTEKNVNHYDIKCDNILLHPFPGVSEEDFWNPQGYDLPFSICLADFGEAKVYASEREGFTARNRGTEYIKSPEMLSVAYASQKTSASFDRRKKIGTNSAGDVWGLGCLFYELLTGEFLFFEEDWVAFYMRVTSSTQILISPECSQRLEQWPFLLEFLEFVLIRNPNYRPTLKDITVRFGHIKAQFFQSRGIPDSLLENKKKDTMFKSCDATSGETHSACSLFETLNVSLSEENSPNLLLEPEQQALYQLTENLFLGNFHLIRDRMFLDQVTHVMNCVSSAKASFPPQLIYDSVLIASPRDFLPAFVQIVDFVRMAVVQGGEVIVHISDRRALGSAVGIGLLMVLNALSYYEAFVMLSTCWPSCAPHPIITALLLDWDRERSLRIGVLPGLPSDWPLPALTYFHCICGLKSFALSTPLSSLNIQSCCCSYLEPSPCPHPGSGCGRFIERAKRAYHRKFLNVSWGLTAIENLRNREDVDLNTVRCDPLHDLNPALHIHVKLKSWELFQCRCCGFLTHARPISSVRGESAASSPETLALVCNLEGRSVIL